MSLMHKVLADSFSSIEDVNRSIKKVADKVAELRDLQKRVEKQLASVSASIMLEINVGDKKSPVIKTDPDVVKVVGMDKMRKNYALVQELYETRNSLEMMEAKLATSFQGKNVSTDRAAGELSKLKRQVDQSLSEAFAFLANLARKHMPEKLASFTKAVSAALERSVVYQSAKLYSYVYELNGDLIFSNYIQLTDLEDDAHRVFPEMFVCCSYRTGNEPAMFLAIQHKFAPPSEDLLVKRVTTPKELLRALNLLLELDNFENSIGSLPPSVVFKPSTIQRDMFSYAGYIRDVEVDDHEISFHLRPSATKEGRVNDIVAQLYKEMNAIQRRTQAKLRVTKRKSDKGEIIKFYFVSQQSSPPVSAEDLSFMKDRFNVNETTLEKVVKVINQGS